LRCASNLAREQWMQDVTVLRSARNNAQKIERSATNDNGVKANVSNRQITVEGG
jgi:hypothetical protein